MTGRRVLLAWELGAGLGHARRLLAIALTFRSRGWDPVVAARHIGAARADYRQARVPVIQAPGHRGLPRDRSDFAAQSYADIMALCCWDDPASLDVTVGEWEGVLDAVRPALVVGDYCPMLPLACLGRVPFLAIGDGFVVPPPEAARMPRLRQTKLEPADDDALLANGNAVLARRGVAAADSLTRLIGGDARVVCTYPELDVYAAYRAAPAAGPLERLALLPPPEGRSLFIYLAADHEGTAKCLQAAVDSKLPARAFVRDAPPSLKETMRAGGLFVHDTPPDLRDELARASAVFHHGGVGTAEAALATGRVQILLPRHLEQTLNARCLGNAGVAGLIRAPFEVSHALAAIQGLTTMERLADRANEVAATVAARASPPSLERIADAAEALLR